MTDYWQTLEDFVLEHYPCSQLWEEGSLRKWLYWAGNEQYLFTVFDDGKLVGLFISRPLDDIESVTGPSDRHDPESKNIYTDLAITTHKNAMKALILGMVSRFGVREKLCFHRHGRSYTPKFYDFRKFSKKIVYG